MKENAGNSPDLTNLKPCDHQAFFDALGSPASPSEALSAAFRRQKEFPADRHKTKPAND